MEKMKILNCEAIIFDLDGTLYDKKSIALYSMLKQWKNLHILKQSNKIRKELKGRELGNRENFYKTFFSLVAENSSKTTEQVEVWYTQSFYKGFVDILKQHYKARKNLNNLLQAAKGRLPLAVFSDYNFVNERLKALNIDKSYFEISAGSEDFGVLKPSARPLLHIASELGVSADKVLVVGDRCDTDGKAAEMAGMMFYHIDSSDDWNHFLDDIFLYLDERG